MAHRLVPDALRQRFIKLCPLPNVLAEKIAIKSQIGFGVCLCAGFHSGGDGPIGGVDGGASAAISVLLQKCAHAVTLFGCISFFKKWEAEQRREVGVATN